MEFVISDLVAVYAAILSTLVAFFQWAQNRHSRRYLCIDHTLLQSVDNYLVDSSIFTFYISNRGTLPTTVTDLLICEYRYRWFGFRKEFDGGIWAENDDRNPMLPIVLNPGDSITLYVDRKVALDAAPGTVGFVPGKRRNVRFLHIKHSQSDKEFIYKFDLGHDWGKIAKKVKKNDK